MGSAATIEARLANGRDSRRPQNIGQASVLLVRFGKLHDEEKPSAAMTQPLRDMGTMGNHATAHGRTREFQSVV